MLKINELPLGYSDAINYQKRENKDKFNQIFVGGTKLDKLMEPSTYFLVGDKGTGKTACAVWLCNTDYMNTTSSVSFINETEYQKFIAMKAEKNLNLSDYASIWKVILLLLICKQIK